MMTVFPRAVSPAQFSDSDTPREDILLLCRLFREERVARLYHDGPSDLRQPA